MGRRVQTKNEPESWSKACRCRVIRERFFSKEHVFGGETTWITSCSDQSVLRRFGWRLSRLRANVQGHSDSVTDPRHSFTGGRGGGAIKTTHSQLIGAANI